MMKKFILGVLAILAIGSLAGCGDANKKADKIEKKNESIVSETIRVDTQELTRTLTQADEMKNNIEENIGKYPDELVNQFLEAHANLIIFRNTHSDISTDTEKEELDRLVNLVKSAITNIENSVSSGDIVINHISDLASRKLAVESKEIKVGELPQEVKYLAEMMSGDFKLSMMSAIYAKSDYNKDEFDLLHDYSFFYVEEENEEKSVKITLSFVEKPLRDYFFASIGELSQVKGEDVTISQYEGRYIINFSKEGKFIDIETNGLNQNEMIQWVEEVIK